jgi:hypothetical protein
MKGGRTRTPPRGLRRRSGDTHELAARLAPLEELQPDAPQAATGDLTSDDAVTHTNGAITVGNQKSAVPNELIEGAHKSLLGLEPVAWVILGLMLAFILFITWQISRM